MITPSDIQGAIKSLKRGKSVGADQVSSEHYIYAHKKLHVYFSLLFNAIITHDYVPKLLMNHHTTCKR